MNTKDKNFGHHIKEAFRDFSVEPSDRVWQNISATLPAPSKAWPLKGLIAGGLAIAVVLSLTLWFMSSRPTAAPEPKPEKSITSPAEPATHSLPQADNTPEPAPAVSPAMNKQGPEKTKMPAGKDMAVDRAGERSAVHEQKTTVNPQQSQPETAPATITATPKQQNNLPTAQPETKDDDQAAKNEGNPMTTDTLNKAKTTFSFSTNPTICFGEDVELSAKGGRSYHWNTGDVSPNITVSPVFNSTYTLSLTDVNGEEHVHDFVVRVSRECTAVTIPSAFSPNGDGINDELQLYGEAVSNFNLNIYDRMGRNVFHSLNINRTWDGTYGGEHLPAGVYVYTLSYRDGQGINRMKKGQIVIVK